MTFSVKVRVAGAIGFRNLNDAIDTTTAQGRLAFYLFASLAEFDGTGHPAGYDSGTHQSRFSDRSCQGPGGWPKGLSVQAQAKTRAVKTMHGLKTHTILEICQLFHLSRATVYRYLAWREETITTGS